MTGLLDFLGTIALVVGVVLWVLMLRSGLANLRADKMRSSESPSEPTPPQ
ncbi:MAG: hypothetical protein N3D11_01860 [Candidatus Sumerlaeia bacterium]|nr:hypothetical protein [Candidatus Sumerlaeia bacterium]